MDFHHITLEQAIKKANRIALINGDDLAFRHSRKFRKFWEKRIKSLGLTLSVGKTYQSKDKFTINSRMFVETGNIIDAPNWYGTYRKTKKVNIWIPSKEKLREVKAVPVLLVHLAKGMSKQNGGEKGNPSFEKAVSRWQIISKNLRSYHDVAQLKKIFCRVFATSLKKSPRSLCLPKEMGGMGISWRKWHSSREEFIANITTRQKIMAVHEFRLRDEGIRRVLKSDVFDPLLEAFRQEHGILPPIPKVGPLTRLQDEEQFLLSQKGRYEKLSRGNRDFSDFCIRAEWTVYSRLEKELNQTITSLGSECTRLSQEEWEGYLLNNKERVEAAKKRHAEKEVELRKYLDVEEVFAERFPGFVRRF